MPRTTRRFAVPITLGLAGALALTGCGSDKAKTPAAGGTTTTASSGSGGVKCSGLSLGFFGALTGDSANLGINERNGASLAIKKFNAANKDCQIKLEEFDSQGDPAQAPALATKAVGNAALVGIVGPAFSGESKQANPIFDEAGLPIVTASATNPALSTNGWKIFHRAVGNDNAQGPAAAQYITGTLKAKKVSVVDDGSEYGKGIADIVRKKVVSNGATDVADDTIDVKATDYSATVTKVKGAAPDVVFFGGYYQQAGLLAKQLKDQGVNATFVGGDGSNDKGFIEAAGTAADGAVFTAPAAPIDKVPGGAAFKDEYKAEFKQDIGLYSVEAFDAANCILDAISHGKTTRKDINDYLNSTLNFKGLSKTYKFDDKGELAGDVAMYPYVVTKGELVGAAQITF